MPNDNPLFQWPTKQEPRAWLTPSIPLFAGRSGEERASDPYDRDFAVVDLYTGLAFGHLLFHDGAAEGLYRTMNSLLLARRGVTSVLDVGCGIGRLLYDCAPLMPEAQFAGVDFSYNMCFRASQILRGDDPVALPGWTCRGRAGVVFQQPRDLRNVSIAQASAEDLPFVSLTFDAVIATLLLCRLKDPYRGLAEMVRVLRPGGSLLLATPLSFRAARHWETFADAAAMRRLLITLGLRIHEWFDGLHYREVIDANGNTHDWNVRVVAATLSV